MTHSIPETNALIIRTPLGNVLHTGDWKLDPTPILNDPTDEKKLRAFGDEGCLALIGDSTNAVREGRSPSEADVAKVIAELIRTAPGRVAVTTFASNAGRLRSVAEGAIAAGREVIVVGRAMDRIVQIARETGYFEGLPEFRGPDAFGSLPPKKVVALCTGSQGEPRAALSRIAEDQHPDIKFSRGDRLIYSARMIPGNEKAVGRVINGLIEQGVEVITDRTHLVHVSGHPRREELEALISWVKPANPHSGAWRGAASDRARRACQALRRHTGDPVPQRRPGAAVGRRPRHRRGAGRPRLQGRRAAGAGRCPHRRRPPASLLCRRGVGGAGAHRGRAAGGRPGIRPDRHPRARPRRRLACTKRCYDAVIATFESLPRGRRRDPDAVAEAVRRAVRAALAAALGQEAHVPCARVAGMISVRAAALDPGKWEPVFG